MAQPPRFDPEFLDPDALDRYDPVVGRMSFAEYLAFEEQSEGRHEYVDGVVYAMTGGTFAHSVICSNVVSRLHALAAARGCSAHGQVLKVHTPRGNAYYPDALVRCGPDVPPDAVLIDDPCLVVEVLSASTSRNDFGDKREAYEEIPTLGAYLVVEARWRCVHRHWRDDAGAWRRETIVGEGGVVPLPCPLGAVLTLRDVYAGVAVGDDPPRPRRVREPHVAVAAPDGR